MRRHLMVDGNVWILPESMDVKKLRDDLKLTAMEQGKIIDVEIELQPEPLKRGTLFINGRVLATAAVVDVDES